jgi:hypothetical protein
VLAVSSMLLARETKALLIGEAAQPRVRASLLRIASEDPDVRCANGVLTVQMGPSQVVAALSADFHDRLNTTQIEECVNRIEAAIKQAHPEVTLLFVKPQSADTWRRRIARLPASQVLASAIPEGFNAAREKSMCGSETAFQGFRTRTSLRSGPARTMADRLPGRSPRSSCRASSPACPLCPRNQ